MNIKKLTVTSADFPGVLCHIPSPPMQLYHSGAPLTDLMKRPRVAIVGTRKVSPYGTEVTLKLARELAEQGIVIVSGLAYGVDALAHRAALEVDGLCIAVLPSPLENIVPVSNRRLAHKILEKGGALVSEYAEGTPPLRQHFIARNRLMSGLADAVLITEAGEKSGAVHTANFAIKQGIDILVVPGSINSPGSVGIHNLLKAFSAAPATTSQDVLNQLGLDHHQTKAPAVRGRNAHEQTVLDLLLQGVREGDRLLEQSGLSVSEFNQVLTMLEISCKIRPLGMNNWAIY